MKNKVKFITILITIEIVINTIIFNFSNKVEAHTQCTQITNNIKYYNCTLTNINPGEFNEKARNMPFKDIDKLNNKQKFEIDSKRTLCGHTWMDAYFNRSR